MFQLAALALLSPAAAPQIEDVPLPRGTYVVVTVGLDPDDAEHARFAAVATEVAEFHDGRVVPFDGLDWLEWSAILQREQPDDVLFVVPPEILDVPLHRRFLLSSAQLDDDPLPDFAFGYFTARDGDALEALWERTKAVHADGLSGTTWHKIGITQNMKSRVYRDSLPDVARAAGYEGDSIYIAIAEDDPDHFEFADAQLARVREAAVIGITGNGDPEGIWLFDGRRNLDRSLHWEYDPARVGEDPDGVMPRITAERFRDLGLKSPVVWSGTCHCAATRRVFVEGDIVSTFGRTENATLHLLPPERSLCLAMIDAGAVAFLAPLGANHGMAVSREQDAALSRGCTLGETIKSTYDDVFLAAGGPPRLDLPVDGQPHLRGEPVMQGGGSNRILIGDPRLAPFERTKHPKETVTLFPREDGFDVIVDWAEGWHTMAWDMYGTDLKADWRVVARVPMADLAPDVTKRDGLDVTVTATGADGKAMPYALRHAVLETWQRQRWLHLQASAPRGDVERKAAKVTFQFRWKSGR